MDFFFCFSDILMHSIQVASSNPLNQSRFQQYHFLLGYCFVLSNQYVLTSYFLNLVRMINNILF